MSFEKLLWSACAGAVMLFNGAAVLAQATLSPAGGLRYQSDGVEIITRDSMVFSNGGFTKCLASIDGHDTTRRLDDSNTKLLRENTRIQCLTTVKNTDTDSEITWDYDVQPNPDGKHLQLTFDLPATLFPDLPANSPSIRSEGHGGVIELDSYVGRLMFDFSKSAIPCCFEDLRQVEWGQKFRFTFSPPLDPQTGAKGKASVRISVSPSRCSAYYCVPVAKYGNQGLVDEQDNDGKGGWTDQGANDLRSFTPGVIAAQGIPFAIGDRVVVLRGTMRMRFPVGSPVIPLDGIKAERLAFCHTVAWGAYHGGKVFEYIITYENGKQEIFPVIYLKDVVDWWGGQEALNARPAWRGVNGETMVALQHAQWKNPHPEEPLKSIQAVSAVQSSVPVILGITAVKTGALNPAQRGNLSLAFNMRPSSKVDVSEWYLCPLDWNGQIKPGSALDVSSLNHAPAGQYGFVKVGKSGHFEFEQRPGEKVRFWGTNVGGCATSWPKKELAAKIAATYARQGVNLVRFHKFAPIYARSERVLQEMPELRESLIKPDGTFDADVLDRFDYFVAQLKQNGIYIYMDWIDGAPLSNVLRDPQLPEGNDCVWSAMLSQRHIDGAKLYAKMLFTHKNPYTGLSMAEDPAFAMFEIINECSFTWSDQPLEKGANTFFQILQKRWSTWQTGHQIKNPVPLAGTPHESLGEPGRRFFTELQRAYLEEMKAYLRKLGVKVPICGTNLTLTTGDLWASQNMDYLNDHTYFGVTHIAGRAPNPNPQSIVNTPPVALPFFPELTHARVAGKPLVGSEWCFVYPGPFRCEGFPLMAAYYSLQDWDGMTFFCSVASFGLNWQRLEKAPRIMSHSQQIDPSTWAFSQAAALAIRRGDIQVAKHTVTLKYTDADIFNNQRYANLYGFLGEMAKVEIELLPPGQKSDWPVVNSASHTETYFEAARRFGIKDASPDYLASDTGEIRRYSSPGLFLVDTPKTQMAAGALYSMADTGRGLSAFAVNAASRFATLTFSSLDNQPLNRSKRILVCAAGNSLNKGAVIENYVHEQWGEGPVLTEPLEIEISAAAVAGAPLRAYALNPTTGTRTKELDVKRADGREAFAIDKESGTMYFELVR